jgi:hypothetical protein
MTKDEFKSYLKALEEKVIIPGITSGDLCKKRKVPTRKGKLHKSDFGKFVGEVFDCKDASAIDYYGYFKKSSGFKPLIDSYQEIEVKSIMIKVCHFASIKIEYVSSVAPELMEDFFGFKTYLLQLRGFKDGGD